MAYQRQKVCSAGEYMTEKKTSRKPGDVRLPKKAVGIFVIWIFVAMGAMFVLGIYVGRGMSPIRFDIQNIRHELAGLKEAMLRAEEVQAKKLEQGLAGGSGIDLHRQLKKPSGDLLFKPKPQNAKIRASVTKKVAAKKPEPEKTAKTDAKTDTLTKSWTIQVAAVTKKQDASNMVDKFCKMGYPAYMVEASPKGKGTIFRVRVGRFSTRNEAKKMTVALAKDWNDFIIVRN